MTAMKDQTELGPAPAQEEGLQKMNVFLVSVGWCLGYSAFFIQVTTTAAKAIDLKGTSLSTVPLGVMLFATWILSFIIPKLLARFGNKIVYVIISLGGAVGAALCLVANEAIENDDIAFALLVLGSMPQGIAHASTNSYRFAATQFAPPSKAPLAISLVIFGGVLSAVIGPEVSKYTRDSMHTEFTGTYILLTAIWTAQAGINLLPAFKPPLLAPPALLQPRRPGAGHCHRPAAIPAPPGGGVAWGELLRRKTYLFGIFGGAASFGAMAGLMAGTPVSMKEEGFGFDTSTTTIELHVVGMFAPAIFTGKVVALLGVVQTVAAGLGLLLLGALLLYISVTDAAVYMLGLTIIGVGWNWSTVASTALITKSYSKHEASTAQGLADGIIIGFLAIAVFSVGFMYEGFGKDWRLFVTFYVVITSVGVVAAIYYWIVGLEQLPSSPEPQAQAQAQAAAPQQACSSPPEADAAGKHEHAAKALAPQAEREQAAVWAGSGAESLERGLGNFSAQPPPPGMRQPFQLVPHPHIMAGQPHPFMPQPGMLQPQQSQYPAGYLFTGNA